METAWSLLQLALMFLAAQIVLGPPALYVVVRHKARPHFQSFDLLNPPLPLPPSYAQSIALLEEFGFHAVAHLFNEKQNTTLRYVLTLFVNEAEKDMANMAHMLSEVPPITRMVVNYVEFTTDFEDGSEVCTNNAKLPSGFVQVPEKKIFRLPHVTDPKQLYAIHRALLARGPSLRKRLPPAGGEVDDLIATMERDLAREAGFGRLKLDSSGMWYRPTMKGAILGSLKLNWPVGFLRRRIQRSRGKRLVREVMQNQ